MKLIIDIDVSPEEFKKIQVFNIKMMDNKITHKVYEAVQRGIPVSDITGISYLHQAWIDGQNYELQNIDNCGAKMKKETKNE